MDRTLSVLRAAGEPTRLRLLALLARGELTVSDLVRIMGQSQPRLSRHLKLLADAGLVARTPEGAFAWFRLADGAPPLLAALLADLPGDDGALSQDRARLDALRAERAAAAADYFRANAADWDAIRNLYAPDASIEARLLALAPSRIGRLLDIGTGTGRMLELLAPRAAAATGIDQSREMLAVARARLADRPGIRLRQGDMYHLPFGDGAFDLVTLHMVLHHAETPAAVLAEAARVLAPGGELWLVDFAAHGLTELVTRHRHRRPGFADSEIARWAEAAGLTPRRAEPVPGDRLTVHIWRAQAAARKLELVR